MSHLPRSPKTSRLPRLAALILAASFLAPAAARAQSAPSAPAVSGAALGVSSIAWTWTLSPDATGYRVLSSTGGGNISGDLPPTASSFTLAGLSTNTAYAIQVAAFNSSGASTSTAFTRHTLAAPTTGLTLVALSTSASTGDLSWGANGNSSGTLYNVWWWSTVSSTITVSTPTTSILLTDLYAGNTLYFTVQAQNGDGIAADFDATFYAGVISTYFPVGLKSVPPLGSQTLTFLVPTGVVTLRVSSSTFASDATLKVQVPAGAVPPAAPGLTPPANRIDLEITATDAAGNLLQPLLPIAIQVGYVSGSLGTLDPAALVLARFDAPHQLWVPLATSRDRSANILRALSDHLSLFSVFGSAPAADLAALTVGPNPLRPVVNPGQVMTFRGLPAGARLRLFTYVGERIADMNADGSGIAVWDGTNKLGAQVASGVYLVLVESASGRKTLRVAVER